MSNKAYIRDNNRSYRFMIMVFCFACGLVVGKIFAVITCSPGQMPIYYISQEEILNLEKERVSDDADPLFYGRGDEVFHHMENFIKSFEARGNQVVLSKGEIAGNNVVSLSREVHARVLEKLKDGNAGNDNS